MPTQHDPEQTEVKSLHDIADLAKAHVLEIGCGDGRLTWRYANHTKRVIGIDLKPERLEVASREYPPTLHSGVAFSLANAETLPFPRESFDLVILSWSL